MDAPGTTWIGPFEPQPAAPDEIDALGAAPIGAVALRADARGAQWTKLLFNAATNPLAALTGPDARRAVRRARRCARRSPRWWTRAARSPTRSGSRSTATPTR